MTVADRRHPQAETMAAFVEGRLAGTELAELAGHLRGCADCRIAVSETARFEREEVERRASARRGILTPRWQLAAAAAIAVLAIIAIPLLRWNSARNASPVAHLIDASPRNHRGIESRLAGFRWARLQPPARGAAAADPADLKLSGAAGDVLEATARQTAPESLRGRGDALLLIGRRGEAIDALERAARTSPDARVWNDLAAARYARAVEDERPSELPSALAAADRALALDPKSPDALFNRALILERLGIRDQARQAWNAFLAVEPGSGWSVEARDHLKALEDHTARFDEKLLQTMPAAELVRRFPQEARTWGEGPLLVQWGESDAPAPLAIARNIGAALGAASGEHLLADAVAAIDRAAPKQRAALAAAHRLFGEGRKQYAARNAGAAEATLRRAAALFREGASPMAEVAEYYAASAGFAQNRGGEAREALNRLAGSIDSARYRALAAQIQWDGAVLANVDGDWETGARKADAAAAGLRALGEERNASFLDGVAADALSMSGDVDAAWSRRIRAYAGLSSPSDRQRLAAILRGAAVTLDRFGHTDAASALLNVVAGSVTDDPAQLAATLTERARLAERAGDGDGARRSIAAARAAAHAVPDVHLREMLTATIDVADAVALRSTQPHAAVAILDRSVELFTRARMSRLLPDAHLQRARALLKAGDAGGALAAYRAALGHIEKERAGIADGEFRLRFLDTASQIIEETIDLHMSRNEIADAFGVSDRARRIIDAGGGSTAPPSPALPSGMAVIEFSVLPRSVAIFCLSGGALIAESARIDRSDLESRVVAFSEAIRRRAPLEQITREGESLYRLLIAPVAARIGETTEMVIVPDRELHALPFAALFDPQTKLFLAERFTIRLASAAPASNDGGGKLQPALVIADPPASGMPRLQVSRTEGERIARIQGATLLMGDQATRRRALDLAAGSALIHFAGHARSDARDSFGTLMLAGDDTISSTEIARLRLRERPLVILAACGTARGDYSHVAGTSSLARAFLLAGARGVVGTLWEVDDDVAAPLFLRVHELLRAGASPARAVHAAQVEMIHASDRRLSHPATWAPVAYISNV